MHATDMQLPHRLTRLQLSATMLGDTAEKSKNPLKKAMRRRNARTVQFSAQPVYFDASDYEYSSDEEDHEDGPFANGGAVQEQQGAQHVEEDEVTQAETQVNGKRDVSDSMNGDVELNGRLDEVESRGRGGDQPRPSEESVIDKQCECSSTLWNLIPSNIAQSVQASLAMAQSATQIPSSKTTLPKPAKSLLLLVSSVTTLHQEPPPYDLLQTPGMAVEASTVSIRISSSLIVSETTRNARTRSLACSVACSRRRKRR